MFRVHFIFKTCICGTYNKGKGALHCSQNRAKPYHPYTNTTQTRFWSFNNLPKMAKNDPTWPKMVWNVKANGPNEARNTNTKLPDLKWRKIAKKNYQKMAKMNLKWPKMTQNGQKYPKNGPKWSEMLRKMVQIKQGVPTPNYLT